MSRVRHPTSKIHRNSSTTSRLISRSRSIVYPTVVNIPLEISGSTSQSGSPSESNLLLPGTYSISPEKKSSKFVHNFRVSLWSEQTIQQRQKQNSLAHVTMKGRRWTERPEHEDMRKFCVIK